MGEGGGAYVGVFFLIRAKECMYLVREVGMNYLGRNPYFTWPSLRKKERYTTTIIDGALA